jgi:hypothetical protein
MIMEDLSYICQKYDLLPKNQFRGRPGTTTSDALHLVEQFIKNAWRKGVVLVLLLDIQATLPNMQKDRLLENMRKQKIHEGFCIYMDMILTHREIHLIFNNATSQPCNPPSRCNQGCLLSMLLYIIYNAPLFNTVDPMKKEECIIGYIDDMTLLAQGKTFLEVHNTIKQMMERKDSAIDWSHTYSSPLEMNKLALVNFSHSQLKIAEAGKLTLFQTIPRGTTKHEQTGKPQAKLLGIILDSKLNWSTQYKKIREKAMKFMAASKRYTKATAGIRPTEALRLYNAVAVLRICYTSDVWYRSLL